MLMIRILLATVCLHAVWWNPVSLADERPVPASEKLRNDQEAVSGRYARFERLLSQMADMLGHEDPERAELLRRAISKGREQAITSELDAIARTLGEAEYGKARERQVNVTKSLQALLTLLQSEDRRSSVEKERERLNNVLKDVRNAIAEERAARGLAQNSTAPSNAAPQQQKALNKTDEILDDVKKHDDAQAAEAGADAESQSDREPRSAQDSDDAEKSKSGKDGEKNEGRSGESSDDKDALPDETSEDDSKPGDERSAEPGDKSEGKPGDKSSDNESQPSENSEDQKPSDKGGKGQPSQSKSKPQQGSPSQGQPNPAQPSEDDQAEQTPGREQIEAALNLMQEALEQLKQQEREAAVDKQDEAIAELQKAARELEEMLKQLREEEKEMVLAALEARLQRLLALQTQIHEDTLALAVTPRKDWLDIAVSQCQELSQQQADLTRECSQTTGLLREDGTSVSILVAMEDVESDMGSITTRLQETKVETLTQSMQTDVIEALKELIEATQREMEEMKSEERQQQQQQSQSQEKPPLVELMAEIRVLRSLQLRVNRRTRQVHELLQESDSADVADLNEQLAELALRQMRLKESAAELAKQLEKKR
ncbi:MAG: hypothetical protein R3C59_06085 [Planctomycetaceae bacterium]